MEENIALLRSSRVSPAFSGSYQARVDYLPCRVFKNVSYRMPAMTNVLAFQQVLGNTGWFAPNIESLVDRYLALDETTWLQLVAEQQTAVASAHTYMHKWTMLFRAMRALYG